MEVGLKDINGVELQDGQHIRIFDKQDNKYVIKGIIKYLPAAFMIYPDDGSHQLLLYWYVRESKTDVDETTARERYEIEILV